MPRIFALLALAMLAIAPVSGQQKPDLSGEWVLNKARTRLQFPDITAIDRGSMEIEREGTTFQFKRVFVIGLEKDIYSYELTADGKEKTTKEGKRKIVSKSYWEGDALVYDTRIDAPQGDATNVVYYRLREDGQVLEAEEHFRGPNHQHDNVWIFERKPPTP
jgi:hypothetical protein